MEAHSRATERHLPYGITCHPTQVNTPRACHWRRSISRSPKSNAKTPVRRLIFRSPTRWTRSLLLLSGVKSTKIVAFDGATVDLKSHICDHIFLRFRGVYMKSRKSTRC